MRAHRILIVDDDTRLRQATRRALESAGYDVIEANSGTRALEMIRTYAPDLVLLDVGMPDLDGFTVCRLVKSDPEHAGTFVVMLSGSRTDSDSQVSGLECGADGYITRPISNRELLARVQAFLRIKAVEDALRAKERQLRDLIMCNVDGMLVVDEQGTALFVNPAALRLFNRTEEDFLGKEIGLPITAGESAEIHLLRPNGDNYVVEMRVAQIEWQGRLAYLASLRDITERKRIEDALRESETKLRALYESMSELVVLHQLVYDASGRAVDYRILECNPRFSQVTGIPREQAIGALASEIYGVTPAPYLEIYARVATTGNSEHFETFFAPMRKYFSISAFALGAGRFATVSSDITAYKRAEEMLREYSQHLEQMVEARTRELREAQEQLLRQERLAMLGQIAGGIGHELRSPLNTINNAVYLLRQTLPALNEEAREALDILTRQVEASNRIITSLLAFARPQPLTRRLTDIGALCHTVLAQSLLPENILVQCNVAESLVINADSDQLQIVFSNLIRNAVQAMPQGGTLSITARQTDSNNVEISFADTGVGIPPSILDKIFQPMFTTRSRGLGLGLALCKLIIEAHDGTISVASQVGKGTTFKITLPLHGSTKT
jgi:signal transduction histidine kinase/DNA-binding response OmpR family regulator